jgi:DNA-binding Lrp family transcriptional regulator
MRLKKTELRKKEILLLAHLRKNGRATLTGLSPIIKVPVSTLHDKLKSQNVIKKHTCIVDFTSLGFTTTATILLKTKKEEKDELRRFLLQHKNVNSVYKINSGFDYLIEGIFHNFVELESFVEEVEEAFSIRGKQVFYVIEEVCKEIFFADPARVRELMDDGA